MKAQIQRTAIFQNLSPIQKKIYGSYKVFKEIEHHYHIVQNKGFEFWKQKFNPPRIIKDIVEEMINC